MRWITTTFIGKPIHVIRAISSLRRWRCAKAKGLSGKDLILATIIAYEIEMRLCEIGRPGVREYGWHHATLSAFAAPVAAGRVLNLTPDQMVSAIGISAARTFCPGAVTAGKLTNMKNTVDPWAGRMGAESALLAREGFSGPEHMIDGKEGLFACSGTSNTRDNRQRSMAKV